MVRRNDTQSKHKSRLIEYLPFRFGLWQSTALLWMGSPLVDGTRQDRHESGTVPNDNVGPLTVCWTKLFEHIENDSSEE